MLKKLPIGTSSLSMVVNNNCLYIDKTGHLAELVERSRYYFLSRPRRFGKTLFLDTLKQAFLGHKELFKDLYLEKNWDWSQNYPVIHISFSGDNFGIEGVLDTRINSELQDIARLYGVELEKITNGLKLGELISKLKHKTGKQVVVLVDEYDKGILDAIDNTELAIKNREILKGFYGIIKEHDADLKFVFVTGVTKFAKAGIFSQLNNLNDITFDANYADICGYTQANIENEFKPYLDGVDLNKLKNWYNGYNFLGTEAQKVYNPFDILLFIDKGKIYKNYWFSTGTPSFLIKLLKQKSYYFPRIEGLQLTDMAIDSFDVEKISVEVLLLQSGYLTISDVTTEPMMLYTLNYPNFEVRQSLNDALASDYFYENFAFSADNRMSMMRAIMDNQFNEIETILRSLLAGIPSEWYNHGNIKSYEGHYCSLIYSYFNAIGFVAIPEDRTSVGRIDLTIHALDKIILFEFKMLKNGDAISALEQIKTRKYHEKYLSQNKPIYIIGAVFDEKTRNICEYAWEQIK